MVTEGICEAAHLEKPGLVVQCEVFREPLQQFLRLDVRRMQSVEVFVMRH
jgi:hypothetical protein